MAEYLIQDTTLDAIADAINAKTGGSSAMTPAEMATAIAAIPTGGGTDLTPFVAVAGEVTPTADSTSLGFPTDGKFSSVNDVLFVFAYVDDYTQFIDQNTMIVGCYKANARYKVPAGSAVQITVQNIDTSRNPPLNYWQSGTSTAINGNNFVVSTSKSLYFKAGVKYNYILVGVGA